MPRNRSPKRDEAYKLWIESGKKKKLKDIAAEIGVCETQVRKWKSQDKWNSNVTNQVKGNVTKRKRGGQPGNHNATGPPGNKNAEKHGLFSKILPEETASIIDEINEMDPLDVLWNNIQIQFAAILRSQKIMYVKDQNDKTTETLKTKIGMNEGEIQEVQLAWDKQANFLSAQSRAMTSLNGLIRQYDAMLKANNELATEEQKARIGLLKLQQKKIEQENSSGYDDGVEIVNDAPKKED